METTLSNWTSNPTPANTPDQELSQMIREELFAKTLANIARRAENLWADGYTHEHFAAGVYHVDSPRGQHYMTTCDEVFGNHCTCPAWKKYGTCKHFLAIQWLLREEQALEEMAAEHEARELADTDPYDDSEWVRAEVRNEEIRNYFDSRAEVYAD